MLSGYEEFLGDEKFTRAGQGFQRVGAPDQATAGTFGTWQLNATSAIS
jgi:hypothetical protein